MSGRDTKPEKLWYVTGTFHGAQVFARSEGDARRAFHKHYGGESILHCTDKPFTVRLKIYYYK